MRTYVVVLRHQNFLTGTSIETEIKVKADAPYITNSGALRFDIGWRSNECDAHCVRGFNAGEWVDFWLDN